MENNIITFSGVRCRVDGNGNPELNLEDVARGLGFVKREVKNGTQYERINKQALVGWLQSFGIMNSESTELPEFIPENIFYKLCFKASNEAARAFQDKVTDEVLPAIRKQDYNKIEKGDQMALQIIDERELFGKQFRIFGDCENPLFLATDVAEWIEYDANSINKLIASVDGSEKLTGTIFRSGQNREMWFLTEDGLYEVLMQSRKPIAKQFKAKVKEILKAIRKQGYYCSTDGLTPMTALVTQMVMTIAQNERMLLETKQQLKLAIEKQDSVMQAQDATIQKHDRLLKQSTERFGGVYKRVNGISYGLKELKGQVGDTEEYLDEKYKTVDAKINKVCNLFAYKGESWRSTIMRLIEEYTPGRSNAILRKAADELKREYGINLDIRLKHYKEKMAYNGCSEQEMNQVSRLDVLENKRYKSERSLLLEAVKRVISAELAAAESF